MSRSIKNIKLGQINYLLSCVYKFEKFGDYIDFQISPEVGRRAWGLYCYIIELEEYKKGFK